jgi:two-component system response regulator FlrC
MKHTPVRFSPQAEQCLMEHAWPGNVRELDNAIQRALILQQGGLIQAADFCLDGPAGSTLLPPLSLVVQARAPALPLEAQVPAGLPSSALEDDLRRREFEMIIETLRSERGRRKEAAERLGISPRTLRYKLAQMRDAGMDVEASLFAS